MSRASSKIKKAMAKHREPVQPEEADVSSIFQAMSKNSRASSVIPVGWNGETHEIRFQVLTAEELELADLRTVRIFREKKEEPSLDSFNQRKAACVLEIACREPELTELKNGKSFYRQIFPDSTELMQICSDDKIASLFEQYLAVKIRHGIPGDSSAIETKEDMDVWLDALSHEANISFLAQLPQHIVALNLEAMALQIRVMRSFPLESWRDIGELRELASDSDTSSSTPPAVEQSADETVLSNSARTQETNQILEQLNDR